MMATYLLISIGLLAGMQIRALDDIEGYRSQESEISGYLYRPGCCMWDDYNDFDWIYMREQASVGKCAQLCNETKGCTGFESSDNLHGHCALWLYGACNQNILYNSCNGYVTYFKPCENLVSNWTDARGNTCQDYKNKDFCNERGYGYGWSESWGTFASLSVDGLDASEVCCDCGGGGWSKMTQRSVNITGVTYFMSNSTTTHPIISPPCEKGSLPSLSVTCQEKLNCDVQLCNGSQAMVEYTCGHGISLRSQSDSNGMATLSCDTFCPLGSKPEFSPELGAVHCSVCKRNSFSVDGRACIKCPSRIQGGLAKAVSLTEGSGSPSACVNWILLPYDIVGFLILMLTGPLVLAVFIVHIYDACKNAFDGYKLPIDVETSRVINSNGVARTDIDDVVPWETADRSESISELPNPGSSGANQPHLNPNHLRICHNNLQSNANTGASTAESADMLILEQRFGQNAARNAAAADTKEQKDIPFTSHDHKSCQRDDNPQEFPRNRSRRPYRHHNSESNQGPRRRSINDRRRSIHSRIIFRRGATDDTDNSAIGRTNYLDETILAEWDRKEGKTAIQAIRRARAWENFASSLFHPIKSQILAAGSNLQCSVACIIFGIAMMQQVDHIEKDWSPTKLQAQLKTKFSDLLFVSAGLHFTRMLSCETFLYKLGERHIWRSLWRNSFWTRACICTIHIGALLTCLFTLGLVIKIQTVTPQKYHRHLDGGKVIEVALKPDIARSMCPYVILFESFCALIELVLAVTVACNLHKALMIHSIKAHIHACANEWKAWSMPMRLLLLGLHPKHKKEPISKWNTLQRNFLRHPDFDPKILWKIRKFMYPPPQRIHKYTKAITRAHEDGLLTPYQADSLLHQTVKEFENHPAYSPQNQIMRIRQTSPHCSFRNQATLAPMNGIGIFSPRARKDGYLAAPSKNPEATSSSQLDSANLPPSSLPGDPIGNSRRKWESQHEGKMSSGSTKGNAKYSALHGRQGGEEGYSRIGSLGDTIGNEDHVGLEEHPALPFNGSNSSPERVEDLNVRPLVEGESKERERRARERMEEKDREFKENHDRMTDIFIALSDTGLLLNSALNARIGARRREQAPRTTEDDKKSNLFSEFGHMGSVSIDVDD